MYLIFLKFHLNLFSLSHATGNKREPAFLCATAVIARVCLLHSLRIKTRLFKNHEKLSRGHIELQSPVMKMCQVIAFSLSQQLLSSKYEKAQKISRSQFDIHGNGLYVTTTTSKMCKCR